MNTYVPDYLWGEMLPSIDNTQLMNDCLSAEKYLLNSVIAEAVPGLYGSKTTASFKRYNLLSFPIESFQNLYHNMVSMIKPRLPNKTHVIQCWLNVFRGNEYIDWHGHWKRERQVLHGFYCVHVTPSFTEYKFEHLPHQVFKIESKESLLVFGKSDGDLHRSSSWQNYNTPRITIAFDIIPVSTLDNTQVRPNHYLPF